MKMVIFMKKLISIVISILLLLSLTLPAAAEEACTHECSTWTDAGENHAGTCSKCLQTISGSHSYVDKEVTAQPTCSQPGSKNVQCSLCGKTTTAAIPATNAHSYSGWTKLDDSSHTGTCSGCSATGTAPHTWNEGTVTTQPTCKDTGIKTFTCTACGATKTESVPKSTSHTISAWTPVDGNSHQGSCGICGQQASDVHSWDQGRITTQPTCKDQGKKTFTCTVCGGTRVERTSVSTEHVYDHGCDEICNLCGNERQTDHVFGKKWVSGPEYHWHECENCGEKTGRAAHTPGADATENAPQKCTVCDYIIAPAVGHSHRFAITRIYDDKGHWFKCSDCAEKKDYEEHIFEGACDETCSLCDYVRKDVKHIFTDVWQKDEKGHWHSCSVCEKKEDFTSHTPGPEATEDTPQLCSDCGFVLTEALTHTHDFSRWKQDETQHWQECTCGEKDNIGEHRWNSGSKNSDGSITRTCQDCLAQMTEEAPAKPFPWFALILMLLILTGGAVVAVLIVKDKIPADFLERIADRFDQIVDKFSERF